MKDISGKRVFLTGASRGIGQQIAYGFAELGCNLILQARKLDNLQETLKHLKSYQIDVETVEGELSDPQSVEAMLSTIEALQKQVDIVYCNAAIMSKPQELFQADKAEWDRVMQINVYSLIRINEFFLPKLAEQGFGRVINVSSGIQDQPALMAYSVSKACVERFTRDLSKEMQNKKVLMNCIDPGWIKTDLGGPNAFSEVDSVLPGMLVPAVIEDDGPISHLFRAQDYVGQTLNNIQL